MSNLAHRPERQARLHVVSFNGTWAGGVLSSRRTVITEFVKLISDCENVFEIPVNGVGSDVNCIDRIIGGIGGWGTLRNVITALRNLSKHYKAGDRIIFNGYSRGAWAARYLAMLINLIGVPKDGDEILYHRLYKSCSNESILHQGARVKLLEGYACWKDVEIDALCCFDTIGSLGLPLTGIAKPLAILKGMRKNKADVISVVAPNVRYAFHCLSLNETRECFSPTLMSGMNVYQVSFPGCHGNMGWIEDTEGLVHGPFAWMIQQVHSKLNISFDENKLAARFPAYHSPSTSTSSSSTSNSSSTQNLPQSAISGWYHGRMRQPKSGLLAVIGKKARKPGLTSNSSGGTDLKVHIGARLRMYQDDHPVPGYTLIAPVTGRPYWTHRIQNSLWGHFTNGRANTSGNESSRSNSLGRTAERIEEADVGTLEARLLGLPDEVVSG